MYAIPRTRRASTAPVAVTGAASIRHTLSLCRTPKTSIVADEAAESASMATATSSSCVLGTVDVKPAIEKLNAATSKREVVVAHDG